MTQFQLGGHDVQVEPWTTWWPASIFNKQQGVEVKVDPERHWWCLWICQSTTDVDKIECAAELSSAIAQPAQISSSCTSCGDLVIRSASSWGYSAPWLYQRADFSASVTIEGQGYSVKGELLYS